LRPADEKNDYIGTHNQSGAGSRQRLISRNFIRTKRAFMKKIKHKGGLHTEIQFLNNQVRMARRPVDLRVDGI
jgi:hypothetical protein